MSEAITLVYLEADDEITTVIRRLRAAEAGRVIVVAPGRSRATSSTVALRLLARTAAAEGREIVLVGDALTRSLANEADLPAYGSVEDARRALPIEPGASAPRHAAIHVVRGPRSDDTAPTMAVAAAPSSPPGPDVAGPTIVADETRPVPTVRPAPAVEPHRRVRRRSLGLAAVLGVAGALLVTAIVAGAMLLPAATITLVPRTTPVTATYEMVVADPDRRSGSIEATATVTATSEYQVLQAAAGVVTFRNFNIGTVEVAAGTLVAAGEQAFETTETVAVPSGSLTGDGRILAGEADAPVVAAAAGPAANLDVGAIDTILNQGTAARLRGFPQNNARLVVNQAPTSGGVDASGPEITEEDIEVAVAVLRAELARMAAEAEPDESDGILVRPPGVEPTIEVPDGLAGTRDEPETEITGSLAWEMIVVDPAGIESRAAERLASDPGAIPTGQELLDESTVVSLGEGRLEGDEVVVPATVTGRAAPTVERDEVLARASGRSPEEAKLRLAELGEAHVELWPGWVASVPELEWRVDVRIEEVVP